MHNNVRCAKTKLNNARENEKVIPFAYLLYIGKENKCLCKYINSTYSFIYNISKYVYLINITYRGVYNYVQKVFRIERRKGRRMYHETFCISEEEFGRMGRNINILYSFADRCAQYYFDAGY